MIDKVEYRAAAAGWPGVILSDTLSVRPLCDISNFTKTLAVAGAQIVPRHAAPAPPGVPADIATHTELVCAERSSMFGLLIPCSLRNRCSWSRRCKLAPTWSRTRR